MSRTLPSTYSPVQILHPRIFLLHRAAPRHPAEALLLRVPFDLEIAVVREIEDPRELLLQHEAPRGARRDDPVVRVPLEALENLGGGLARPGDVPRVVDGRPAAHLILRSEHVDAENVEEPRHGARLLGEEMIHRVADEEVGAPARGEVLPPRGGDEIEELGRLRPVDRVPRAAARDPAEPSHRPGIATAISDAL